jgi:hypothetical protein
VKRDPGSDHGVAACTTPRSGHSTLGTSATSMVRSWQVSRCRQR